VSGLPAVFTLIIALVAAILLLSERLRPDVIALLVLVVLGLSRIVTPEEAFAGFSGSAVMTILAISVISEALRQTGITRKLAKAMRKAGGQSESQLTLITMLASAALSLVMNNIAAVGVLLPAVTSLARQTRTQPSRLLMPLAFGTILGGMATLLTTSNIIVSGALRDAGYAPFGLLDFLPVGLPVAVVGVLYMLFWGRRFLPNHNPTGEAAMAHRLRAELASLYGIERSLCNVTVMPGSSMAGQSIQGGKWMQQLGLSIVGLMHNGSVQMAPSRDAVVKEGDIILAQGNPSDDMLLHYGLRILEQAPVLQQVTDENVILAEVVLSPHTNLVDRSLREIHFREKYGFNVLGVWREGKPVVAENISELPLRYGDALLLQGPAGRLRLLQAERDFIVLEGQGEAVARPGKARIAAAITFLALAIAATGWLPIAEVTLAGAVLLLLTGCLSMDEAYRSIEWKAIFLIAGMWPLSAAIRSTGLADLAVGLIFQLFGTISPLLLAAILLAIALLLTQLMGGQVASLAMAPLALSAAVDLGVDPRSMGMAVALGCSLAFLTPFGHPVNLMVMSPGGYTFRDFVKVGAPLTILVMLVILAGLYFFWGL